MTDITLHCNTMSCRKALSQETHACVTCCSHIFCLECASKAFNQASVCPECRSNLGGSEDIVITKLNPTEEYKSSVLAGLRPEIIMDICSRAISFYEYQVSQEINYRAMFQKKLEVKFNMLYEEYKLSTHELNYVLKAEKEKQSELTKEYESERRKNQELDLKFQEKSKQFQKLQLMYEKIKRKLLATVSSDSTQRNNLNVPLAQPTMSGPSFFRNTPSYQTGNKGPILTDNMSRMGAQHSRNHSPSFTGNPRMNSYQGKSMMNDMPFYQRQSSNEGGPRSIRLSSFQAPSARSTFNEN